jgi:hypothetical protein
VRVVSNAWKAIEEAMWELNRLGHVGQSVDTIDHAHKLRDLSDGLMVARSATTDLERRLLDLDAENERLKTIIRKLGKARVVCLYELTASDQSGMSVVQLTYEEAGLLDQIINPTGETT